MMQLLRRGAALWLLLVGLLWLTAAAFESTRAGQMTLLGAGKPPAAAGGCSEATTYLARVSVDAGHTSAYTTLICGLVTDGVWTLLDMLYIYNTQNETTARINLPNATWATTTVGTLTFSADHGYPESDGSNHLSLGFNAAAGTQYTQNSASFGCWSRTSGAYGAGGGTMVGGSGHDMILVRSNSAANMEGRINQQTFEATIASASLAGSGVGLLAIDRNTAVRQMYENGATSGASDSSITSSARDSTTFVTDSDGNAISQAVAMCFAGAHMTSTQHLALYNRYTTWNTAISGGNP
jgi:hypothetical protein